MTERIRVMVIGARYKMHLYQSLSRYVPDTLHLRFVSADLCYGGKMPIISKHGIGFMPTRRMMRELIRFRPDMVFTDYPAYPSWYAKVYSYLRREHIPIVAWLLGDFWTEYSAYFTTAPLSTKLLGPFYFFTWSTGLNLTNRILAVCRWLEEIVKVRFPGKTTGVLYQGVDPEPWLVQDDSPYPFRHPAVGILQENNILPKVKGLLWFSEVVKQMDDINFYIAGSGPYTSLVEKAYSGLRNAHLMGKVPYPDGVRRFHMSTDIYVLPSGLDCCPTTLLEASLCAKPIVASRVGGIPELIMEGETGWTVQNGCSEEWVSTIRSAVEDVQMARSIGENARNHVLNHYSWDAQAARLTSIIKELFL